MAPFSLLFCLSATIIRSAAYSSSLARASKTVGSCGVTTTTCLSAAATPSTTDNAVKGLLSGIDVTSAKYYSSQLKMDTTDDIKWLMEPGLLWEAVVKDAKERNITPEEYIKDVEDGIIKFKFSGKVHDREAFYTFLETMFRSPGGLRLVLGGKSVGKSLVLRDVKE